MPFETGSLKPSVAFAAIAASTALPPRFRISIPTCVAAGTLVQTIPCRAKTSDRVAKFLPVIRSIWELAIGATVARRTDVEIHGIIFLIHGSLIRCRRIGRKRRFIQLASDTDALQFWR